MNRKVWIAFILCILVFCIVATQGEIQKSSGAHEGSTGAPGEQTCAQVGCHSDATVLPGDGVNTLTFNGGATTTYSPGQTYPMTVRIAYISLTLKPRYGFQIVALDENEHSVGTFTLTEPGRTQLQSAVLPGGTRQYITHTLAGTASVAPGVGEWSFNWTAPTNYSGKVTFYYATNGANNDNTNQHDAIFLSSFAINGVVNGVKESVPEDDLSVFLNPDVRLLHIHYTCRSTGPVEIGLYDLQARLVQSLFSGSKEIGSYDEVLSLSSHIPSGVYYLVLKNTRKIYTQRVCMIR